MMMMITSMSSKDNTIQMTGGRRNPPAYSLNPKNSCINRLPSASFDEWWSVFCMLGVPGSCTIIIIILRVLAEIEFYKRTIMATCYKYCLELLEELQTSAVIFSKYFPPNTAKYFLQKPTQIFSPVSWQERIKCRAQHSSLKYKIWKNCPDFNVDVQRKVKQ